ncbi:MAG TPA: hypothetical protein VMG30_03415 [Acidobacteriota bacterium]|nr:hypothetical protein [Acidobacteriota bacterium]
MKLKPPIYLTALLILLIGPTAWADQIILKDGTVFSGKFIRGDANQIDFRVLGRVESFKTAEISKLVFGEPELEKSAGSPAPRVKPQASPVNKEELAPIQEKPRPQLTRADEERPAPQDSTVTVPKGMSIVVRTTTDIDTERNRVGDPFEAILDQNLVSGTQTVAPRGSLVKGRIAYSKESGKLSGQAQLVLELTDIVVNGKIYPLRSSDYSQVGSSRGNRTAATVGGTTAVGAVIGAIAGGGKGAAIGAASGAAVGTGVQVITKGQVLRIPAETILEFRLESSLTIDVP